MNMNLKSIKSSLFNDLPELNEFYLNGTKLPDKLKNYNFENFINLKKISSEYSEICCRILNLRNGISCYPKSMK